MKTILTVIGTRPEAIKLAPVLVELNKSWHFINKTCITKQHSDLLDSVLLPLGIVADYKLQYQESNGSLHSSAANILRQLEYILAEAKPDLVIVQGDTTTAFVSTLAAFYSRISVAHVEAGLRTGKLYYPWPEEAHRCLIDQLSSYFFVPTKNAQKNLLKEGVPAERIWVVGNTSIDAINLIRKNCQAAARPKQRTILATIHRRENHGAILQEICYAIRTIAEQFFDINIKFCLHANHIVRNVVIRQLSGLRNVNLIEPLEHRLFIEYLDASIFVMTDSGGVQEESTFVGKPVLVIRDTTERPEVIQAGTAQLVGTKAADIITCCRELLENDKKLNAMSKVHFPYGKGDTAKKIVKILEQELTKNK